MTDTVEVTLKPCPFCGHCRPAPFPANRNSKDRIFPIVRCMGCFTDVPGKNDDYSIEAKTAITAWNTRHEATRELVELCEYAIDQLEEAGFVHAAAHIERTLAKHTETPQGTDDE